MASPPKGQDDESAGAKPRTGRQGWGRALPGVGALRYPRRFFGGIAVKGKHVERRRIL